MSRHPTPPLRLVPSPHPPFVGAGSGPDLGLLAAILAIALIPVAGVLVDGSFSPSEAGAGTAVALLAARELAAAGWSYLRGRRA